jgi:hypothetical protein
MIDKSGEIESLLRLIPEKTSELINCCKIAKITKINQSPFSFDISLIDPIRANQRGDFVYNKPLTKVKLAKGAFETIYEVGDLVTVLFNDTSLRYINKIKTQPEESSRIKHDQNAPIIIGKYNTSDSFENDYVGFELDGNSYIKIFNNGKLDILINNISLKEALKEAHENTKTLIDLIKTLQYTTAQGPATLTNGTVLDTVKTASDASITKINNIFK